MLLTVVLKIEVVGEVRGVGERSQVCDRRRISKGFMVSRPNLLFWLILNAFLRSIQVVVCPQTMAILKWINASFAKFASGLPQFIAHNSLPRKITIHLIEKILYEIIDVCSQFQVLLKLSKKFGCPAFPKKSGHTFGQHYNYMEKDSQIYPMNRSYFS
jgi:hypothetical protein